MWQHWSNPHTILSWLQLIFNCFLEWNQHWRDGVFCDATDIILECGGTVERAFTKWLPGMCPTPWQFLAVMYICTRGLFWRICSLNDCTVLLFLSNKAILWTFWKFHVLLLVMFGELVKCIWYSDSLQAGQSRVKILAGARNFLLSKTIQTSFESHPGSYSTGTKVLPQKLNAGAWFWLLTSQ
jgi:hypothetical protein